MGHPIFIQIPPEPIERFRLLLGDGFDEIEAAAERARGDFSGRAIWHVNSTAQGGGVAELLRSVLPYVRGAGVDTRWMVLDESPQFFDITKRIHNRLHGDPGDGGELGEAERGLFEATLNACGRELVALCQPCDIVYLHDPQTAGLIGPMVEVGVKVVWRCHVGVDEPNDIVRETWEFLRRYVERADAIVFSRRQYVWDGLEQERTWIMPPAIDPFAPKNQELGAANVEAILGQIGLGAETPEVAPSFRRADGTPDRVERQARLLQEAPIEAGAPIVAQVSRWDRLKDPRGVLDMFVRHLGEPVHLVLAGPTDGVSDDPEGSSVYGDVAESWRRLDPGLRARAHLVSLPMEDIEENAAMINAIQRRADVVIQKSIAEGFGLTVAEAMWKRRPVVASGVGGIRDQIVDGESGLLVEDPHDLEGFATAIQSLLDDPDRAAALGEAAHRRVIDSFLAIRRLREYVDLVASLL